MENLKQAVGLPLSIITSIVCAVGGCCLFAAYFWIVGELVKGLCDYSIDILRNFTFIFVFTGIFSATLRTQKIVWKGGKYWDVLHVVVVLLYLFCYMFKFWPQPPVYYPQFTVRAFLWYGGACAFSVILSHYSVLYNEVLKSSKVARKLYRLRHSVFILSALMLAMPLVMSIFSGTEYKFSPPVLIGPLVLVILVSLFFVVQEKSMNLIETMTHLITQWFSLGACFLAVPIIFLADLVVSNFYGELFEIQSAHLFTAAIAFAFLTISFSFLPLLILLIRTIKSQKS